MRSSVRAWPPRLQVVLYLVSDTRPEVKDKALAGFNKYRGTPHTAETKERLSEIMKLKQNGISNSQFGTMWITNGILSKKIRKTDIVPEGWLLGRKIVGSEDPN